MKPSTTRRLTSFGSYDSKTEDERDPLLHHRQIPRETQLNPDMALVSLMKALLGTGLLGLPIALKHAGLYVGMALLVVIILIDTYCMRQMVIAAHYFGPNFQSVSIAGGTIGLYCHPYNSFFRLLRTIDYANVVKEAAEASGPSWLRTRGRPVKLFVNGVIFVNGFGVCCVYFVFMADNLEQVINSWTGTKLTQAQWMAVTLGPVLLLSLVRHLRTLAPLSYAANLGYIIAFVIMLQYLLYDHKPSYTLPAWAGFEKLPLYFGTVMFSFEAIVLILPVENRVTDPYFFKAYNGPLISACLITLCIYISVGYFGYLKAGDAVRDSITLNLPTDKWIYQVAKLLFVFAVFVSYAYQFYPPIERIEKWLARRRGSLKDHPKYRLAASYVIRVISVMITFALAELIPHFNLFMALVGSVAGTFLAMICPPIVYLWTMKAKGEPISWWNYCLQIFICLLGVVGLCSGAYGAIAGIVEALATKPVVVKT